VKERRKDVERNEEDDEKEKKLTSFLLLIFFSSAVEQCWGMTPACGVTSILLTHTHHTYFVGEGIIVEEFPPCPRTHVPLPPTTIQSPYFLLILVRSGAPHFGETLSYRPYWLGVAIGG
jgi:hypothetical protein